MCKQPVTRPVEKLSLIFCNYRISEVTVVDDRVHNSRNSFRYSHNEMKLPISVLRFFCAIDLLYLSFLRRASSASFRRAFASFFALFFSSFASFFASFCLIFSAFSSSFCRAFSAFSLSFSRSFSFFNLCISCTTDIFGTDVGLFVVPRLDVDVDDVDDDDDAELDVAAPVTPLGLGDVSSCVTIFWAHLQTHCITDLQKISLTWTIIKNKTIYNNVIW